MPFKTVKIIIKLLFGLIILALFIIIYAYESTRNPMQGELRLPGLQGKVTIIRDKYGIAHITAERSDLDAFFALAYVHSQDRFWQMEFQRHILQGSLSELFGPSTIESDKFLRTLGFYHAAELAWPALDTKTKAIVQAYTDGVNAFLRTGLLPLQFKICRYQPKPWTVIDSIAWQKMMAFDLKNDYNLQWRNLILLNKIGLQAFRNVRQGLPANTPTTLSAAQLQQSGLLLEKATSHPRPFPQALKTNENLSSVGSLKLTGLNSDSTGFGSNAWVTDGSKTTTGKPLLANDPHLGLGLPSIWYLAELCGPTLHVTGATIPGLPMLVVGHNDHIAWGITSAEVEVIDLYVHPKDEIFETHQETISVKGQPPIKIAVQHSRLGPIINSWLKPKPSLGAAPISIQWTGLFPKDTSVTAFIGLNYAVDWKTFREALQNMVCPSLNVLYADVKGNVGYQLVGHIPLRENPRFAHRDYLPLNTEEADLWYKFIPFEQLPYTFNPSSHQIISANNKIVPDVYPNPLTRHWEDPGYRAMRINHLLAGSKWLTLRDMQRIQLDTLSELWLMFKPYLLKTIPLNEESIRGLFILKKWDGRAEVDSIGATVFTYWYKTLIRKINAPLKIPYSLSEAPFILQQLSTDGPYCRFAHISCRHFLSKTLQQSMRALEKNYGRSSRHWQWGRIHQTHFKELGLGEVNYLGAIWNRSVATSGAESTVNVGGMRLPKLDQVYGASLRQVIDLHHLDNSEYIISTGQSDDPFSPHHTDLMKLWQQGQYIRFNVLSSKDSRLVLLPKKYKRAP